MVARFRPKGSPRYPRRAVDADQSGDPQRVKEADLVGHLNNGNDKLVKGSQTQGRSEADADLLSADYQLNEALNLLKALSIVASNSTRE